MKRSITLCFAGALVFLAVSQRQVAAQDITVSVRVEGTAENLTVRVSPWQVTIPGGRDVEWVLEDPKNLVPGGERLEISPAPCLDVQFPPTRPSAPPSAKHGPFKTKSGNPSGFCKYTIAFRVRSLQHLIKIDPDYRIDPGDRDRGPNGVRE